jgi:hypothetical protein
MFTDPQSVTVNAVAQTLPRVGVGASSAVYSTADGNTKMTVSHANGKRNRRNARLDFRKIAADPLLDGVSREYSMSAYIVIDHPTVGFTNAEVETNTKALLDKLATAGTLTKLIGGES